MGKLKSAFHCRTMPRDSNLIQLMSEVLLLRKAVARAELARGGAQPTEEVPSLDRVEEPSINDNEDPWALLPFREDWHAS